MHFYLDLLLIFILVSRIVDGYFGPPGDMPIWLDDLSCEGNETRLIDCPHPMLGEHNCEHFEDVAIACLEQINC